MAWTEIYRGRVTTAEEAVKAVSSGDHLWLHAGCNNPEELVKALVGRADELEDVEVVGLHDLIYKAIDFDASTKPADTAEGKEQARGVVA